MTATINIKQFRDEALVKSNSPLNVHDHLQGKTVEELQDISLLDRRPWHTICLNITGDLNVGTIIRTSHCLGAKSVIIFGRQKIDNRSLVGSANYIKVERIAACDNDLNLDLDKFVEVLKYRKLTPIFVESGGTLVKYYGWDDEINHILKNGREACLVMGNETNGIPENFLKYFTRNTDTYGIVSIPQLGVIRSFNVGVAHGIVASDMCLTMGWI